MNLSIPSYRFAGRNLTDALYMPLLPREHLHGVESAGLMTEVPLGKTFVVHLELAMHGNTTHAFMKAVSPDLQKVFGFRMAAGRFFGPQDTAASQPVIVVNKAYAEEHSPDPHNPLAILGHNLLSLRKGFPQMRIIGVIDDERQEKVAEPAVPEVELALPQITPESGYYPVMETVAMDLAARTSRPTSEVIPELRAILKQQVLNCRMRPSPPWTRSSQTHTEANDSRRTCSKFSGAPHSCCAWRDSMGCLPMWSPSGLASWACALRSGRAVVLCCGW